VRHHANHDEDFDDSGIFEGNEQLFPPNVLRPEDITNQEVRGFYDGEVLQRCRTDTANQRGGSEWEPIKILLEGDGNSNKMNTASNTRLRLTTQVGQAHVATGVPLT
jgi:hypothetical protein